MGIQTMFPPSSVKPVSQYSYGADLGRVKTGFGPFTGVDLAVLRDNFKISTWILIGCAIQSVLSITIRPSLAALPAFLLLSWGIINALLMSFGVKKNVWMKGVIDGKISVAYPAKGQRMAVDGQPGDNGPGAVMILGTRSNSPLGMFAPGFKEIGDRFRDMLKQLEDTKETSGFMGMSTWLGAGERPASNEYATISYWRSTEDIHQFALSPIHRDTWNWWNNTVKEHSHLGIMHEIFEVPKHNGWEGIYANYHPTGLAATTRLVNTGETKEGLQEWVNPIIDASRGVYRTSRGRMSKGDTDGSSNDRVAINPYIKA